MDALLVTSEGDPGEPVARGPGTPHLVQLHAQRHPAPVPRYVTLGSAALLEL